jgi:TonB family protein
MEPATSARYCEGCGSRLSRHETDPVEASVTGPDHWAADGDSPSNARCDSCGGPNANGDLCGSCQRAFFSSWLDGAATAPAAGDTTTAVADAAPIQESLAACGESESPTPFDGRGHGPLGSDLETSVESVYDRSDMAPLASLADPAVPAPMLAQMTITSLDDTVAASTEVISEEAVEAKTARRKDAKLQAVRSNGARTDAAPAERSSKPAVVNTRPKVPVPSDHGNPAIALAAAGVVVAAIGVGAYWLQFHDQPMIAREEQQAVVAQNVTVTKRRPSASGPSAAAITGRHAVEAPPKVPAPARSKPAASAPAQVPARSVRAPSPATRQVASVSVPTPATEAPAPAVAAPAPDVVATPPPPVPPAPPVGRFFETMDVNELPHVATRVAPQLPDELRTRPVNEVVIVRALVSQGGRPSRVSLLRRSKAGPHLDNAVIAAVNQWTFSPARKRGEAVSCWFNFGVPVGVVD